MTDTWIDELADRHRRQGVALDANLLVLWVVGTLNARLIAEHRRLSDYRREHFDALRWILARFRLQVTTPHVLAEASDLATSIRQPYRRQILETLAGIIATSKEHYLTATDLCGKPEFLLLGLTDSAVADLARRNVLILTDDKELLAQLRRENLGSLSIREIQVV